MTTATNSSADTGATKANRLPPGPLIAYYGDDLTGSTDVMDVMTFAGLPTVLFLKTPDARTLADFATYRCVGIAGLSRSRSPAWMETNLPDAFAALATLGAPILHYKICSTFDSAPHVGSIGRAIDIGLATLDPAWVPIVVGAPRLRRYQAFGNLFATVDGEGYRLDRHPTMARHPVTPMREADLRRHLAEQTDEPTGLIDLVTLKEGRCDEALRDLRGSGRRTALVDVIDEETSREAGRLIWDNRDGTLFSVSSSGLQDALVAYWRSAGLLAPAPPPAPAAAVEAVAIVSGSCSPVTARQIRWAADHGFRAIRVGVDRLREPRSREAQDEIARATGRALAALGEGLSPIVYTALGPDDPTIAVMNRGPDNIDSEEIDEGLGHGLGEVLAGIVAGSRVRRLAIAGGDSSGRAAARLGIDALIAIAPLVPGAPLCRTYADHLAHDGLEVAFKGGQMGDDTFFGTLRNGQSLHAKDWVCR